MPLIYLDGKELMQMSFNSLKKDVLLQIAEDIGVDATEDDTKTEIIAKFAEEDFTWDDYKEAYPDPMDLPDKPEEPSETADKFSTGQEPVLVKMNRGNQYFEVRGYKFSRRHPFLPVDKADADYILNNVFGFAVATPQEVEEFYS